MTPPKKPGYSSIQIALHWTIAALVLFQLLFGESMVAATDAAETGEALAGRDAAFATAHYWVGIAVLVLVALRLGIRVRSGGVTTADSNVVLAWLAKATHWTFYALLVIVPVSGLLTVYVNPDVGEFHQLAKPVLIVLIALHAGAALFHHFVLRDGTLKRMLRPMQNPERVIR